MSQGKREPTPRKKQLLFIFPLVYRPQKVDFAGKYKLLSRWYKGHVVALSGGKQRNVPLTYFLFHSDKSPDNVATRFVRSLWFQVTLPLRLVHGKSRVDAVIAYDPYRSGLAALILKSVFRCKMIIEVNGEYHTDYEKNEAGQTYIKRVVMQGVPKLILRNADAIKVLNIDQEKFIRQLVPSKPVYRFPNFVATEYFRSLADYQGDYFLSIGHPFHRKGVDVLIKAFTLVAEKHRQVKLKIMGYCPNDELDKYRKIAQGHPRIEFIKPGWIEDVGELLRGCYALVSAARSEAMGRILIETMACGKPIVATRTSGGMLCVADEQTGFLCAIDDVEDLARKLDELLLDPDRANRMGQAGKMRMQEMFSEAVYAETFSRMLEEVTQQTSSA